MNNDINKMDENEKFVSWLKWTQEAVKEETDEALVSSLHNRVAADYLLTAREVILTQLQLQELQFRGLLKDE